MFNIKPNNNILILTGAGISQESGLETFRAANGLWANYNINDVCTPEALASNPALVQEFYNLRRREILDQKIQPNGAHLALARLQEEWQGDVTIITQNIDNLHERGGSKNIIHMHGEILKISCQHCYTIAETQEDCTTETACTNCGKNEGMRPHVVFFGEDIHYQQKINYKLTMAHMFVSIGTSGNVAPASIFVARAKHNMAETVEINLEPSKNAHLFSQSFYGLASIEVPKFVDNLLQLKP